VIKLASQYGRYGCRWINHLLRRVGWRMARIWRAAGLKVPEKQPKRSRLWLNDGSCIRLRLEFPGTSGVMILSQIARMIVGLPHIKHQ
jgi:putative transposase